MMKKERINVLFISTEYNMNCGVSRYIRDIVRELHADSSFNIHLIISGGDAVNYLQHIGIKVKKMRFRDGILNFAYIPVNIFQLLFYCMKHEIHIIHSNHRYPEFVAWIVSKVLKIKTISTLHSIVNGFRAVSYRSDILIAVSKYACDHVVKTFSVSADKIRVMYNCLPEMQMSFPGDINTFKKKYKIPPENKVLLFSGRQCAIKGFDIIISAFTEIVKLHRNITLILISQSNENIKKLAPEVQNQIVVIRPAENMSVIYGVADIIVIPSRMESFPYTMLEAGYFRKMLIASDIGGISEFVSDKADGLLFKTEDTEMLISKILWAVDNEHKWPEMSRNLEAKIKNQCIFPDYITELKKIYQSMMQP